MPGTPDPDRTAGRAPRRIRVTTRGPLLVDGPVELVLDDGSTALSRRPVVAVCTCRRSRIYPWCDTSHRRRPRGAHHGGRTP
ncbi:CDGSH iron-sulfur domain-containing protein [Streptomyces sp. NPDC004327]|uniref:CDGSH iron-sulfur domain-containing protein n=1 Tax=unclassified Streptomyces TaxID=2593676 RepID=UPI00369615DE